jgi:hypothetical protein
MLSSLHLSHFLLSLLICIGLLCFTIAHISFYYAACSLHLLYYRWHVNRIHYYFIYCIDMLQLHQRVSCRYKACCIDPFIIAYCNLIFISPVFVLFLVNTSLILVYHLHIVSDLIYPYIIYLSVLVISNTPCYGILVPPHHHLVVELSLFMEDGHSLSH